MSQACLVCNHPNRLEIDRLICRGVALAKIGRDYDVSAGSVAYHAENHLSHQLIAAVNKKVALENMNLLGEIENLLHRTKRILSIAEHKQKYGLALAAIKEARGTFELLSKIAFALHQARLAELEIEKERSGEVERERAEAHTEKLSILTDAELMMLNKLQEKVKKQTIDIIIPGEPPFTMPKYEEQEALPQREEQAEPEPAHDEEAPPQEEVPQEGDRVRPIEPVEIPSGRSMGRYRVSKRSAERAGGASGVWYPKGEEGG